MPTDGLSAGIRRSLLSLLLLSGAAMGQDDAAPDGADTAAGGSASAGDEAPVPTPFVPSDQISPDSVITFPADI